MPRYRENISSFLNGEVSPKTYGRTELAQYKQSCEKIRNAVVLPQGGVMRRPGSQYQATLTDSVTDVHPTNITRNFGTGTFTGGNVKLVPFVISETQSYVVVLGVGQGANTDDGLPVLVYDSSNTAQVWIARFNENIGSYQNSNIGIPRWIPSDKEAVSIQVTQRGNVLFFTSEYMMPFALEYTGDLVQTVGGVDGGPFILRALESWYALGRYPDVGTTSTEVIGRAFPYDSVNIDTTKTVDLSADGAEGDAVTITCSTSGIITRAMLGCPFKITNSIGTTTGIYKILSYNTGTNVADATILKVGGGLPATSFWHRPQWFSANPGIGSAQYPYSSVDDEGARYWPRAVTFFQNRLVLGGNTAYPATVWGSAQTNVADFKLEKYNGGADLTNAAAFGFEIASTEYASIRWLSSAKTLQIGTLGREYIAEGPDPSLSLGPLNVSFNGETNHGSALVQPIRSENALVFAQRSGRKVREFTFNFAEDSYRSQELSIFADHMPDITETNGIQASASYAKLGDGTIIQIAHQEIPNGITWFLDDYGGLSAMTRNRQLEIVAFHHHLLGGAGPTGLAKTGNAEIKSICVVPSIYALHDDLWMAVRRVIDSTDVCYLEKITKEFLLIEIPDPDTVGSTPDNYMIYADCAGVFYDATPASSATFSHLPGATVDVVADFKYLGSYTLNGAGVLTLPASYNSIIVGFNYRTLIKTLNLEAGSAIGTSQGAMKRVDEVNMRFNRTIGAKFGPDEDTLQDIDFRPATLQDDPIPLFSDDQTLKFKGGHKRKAHLCIVQDLPLPMQVTSLVARLVESD